MPIARAARAGADTVSMSADSARTGWYPDEAKLAPSSINDPGFGQLFSSAHLDGSVYAQPLVRNGTALVVTENNSAYGLDAVTGAQKWTDHFGAPFDPQTALGCGDLTPFIGITSTPVIDPATNIAYFTSKEAGPDTMHPTWLLHAVAMSNGAEQANFPVTIAGSASNDPGTTFDPLHQMQRPGLALVNGVVYMAFGSHCDVGSWLGWVVGVSTGGVIESMWADETAQSGGGGGGIWQSGSAPVVDGTGHLYLVTGNGSTAPPSRLAECVIKLNTATGGTNGKISLADWFCPSNAAQLNSSDGDLGSGAPVQLPASFGSVPMLLTAGKSGELFVLNMNNMGGGPNSTDNVVSEVGPYGGVWSKGAAWPGEGGYVYLPTASSGNTAFGTGGELDVYRPVPDGAGNVSLSQVAKSADAFGFSSSSPVITSDGTTTGSGVVWIVHTDDGSGAGATLRAYEAVPQNGQLVPLWKSGSLHASKFTPPAVDNGRVYVGTRDGFLLAFGALSGAPPLAGNAVSFPPTGLGSANNATATFTATGTVTVNQITVQTASSSTPEFSEGAPSQILPVQLTNGQQITVPLTFTPSQLGAQSGTLTASTDQGVVNLPLAGTGTAPTTPIQSSPPSIDFGTLPSGGSPSATSVSFTNNSSGSFTVTGVGAPGAPFTLVGAPTNGTVVGAGQSIGIGVRFTPPHTSGNFAQTFNGQLTLQTDIGNVLVPVRGAAAPPAQIAITPTSLKFGSVALGHTATLSFKVSNVGGTPLGILKSKPPVANRFAATTALAEGTTIPAHGSLTETIRFTPRTTGTLTDHWLITGNDGSGVQTVTFTGTAARLATVPAPTARSWKLNGSAAMSGSTLRLTPARPNSAGSAFWPHPLYSSALDVSFVATMNGGTGADGLTLTFADASAAKPSALGGRGALLGFGGIPGIGVALDTYPNATNSGRNSIGVVTGLNGSALRWTAIDSAIPDLRAGTHLIGVRASGGVLTVFVDGLQAFRLAVKLPPTVYLGFTGATGGATDVHAVSSVQIAGRAVPTRPKPVPLRGFRLVGTDGGVFTYGVDRFYGSTGAMHLNAPIVGMASNPRTGGYWLVARDGGVFAFHAPFLGSTGGMHLNAPIVGMASTGDGRGYWLVARDGGVFAFGDARFFGSTGGRHLNAPIVAIAADAKTGGYWLLAADGGVFAFHAPFLGSAGGRSGGAPMVGMSATADGGGYWLVASDGGVYPEGHASSFGRRAGKPLVIFAGGPIVGIVAAPGGAGYVEVEADGEVFAFGLTTYKGARVVENPKAPIVGASG